jgi:hypothetical protein
MMEVALDILVYCLGSGGGFLFRPRYVQQFLDLILFLLPKTCRSWASLPFTSNSVQLVGTRQRLQVLELSLPSVLWPALACELAALVIPSDTSEATV